MLIKKVLAGGGKYCYQILLEGDENPGFEKILEGWLDALEFHEMKSRDYKARNEMASLGIKGEFPKVWGKLGKLKSIFWDGRDVLFEGGQELIMDLMGSIGLMLHEQKKVKDKYSAGWRINSGNKPTFGPGPYDPDDEVIVTGPEPMKGHVCEFIGRPRACGICGLADVTDPAGPGRRNPGY